MSSKESNLYKALDRIEEQLKSLQDTVSSIKKKYKEDSLKEDNNKQTVFDFYNDPNCPKCGRHDYALYGSCLSCDDNVISILPENKTKNSLFHPQEMNYECEPAWCTVCNKQLDSFSNCKNCVETILIY